MKDHFNVTIIKPANYVHSLAFWEFAEAIAQALIELGYFAELSINNFKPGYRNIVFGAHLLSNDDVHRLPTDAVIVNTEPLVNNKISWNSLIVEFAKHYQVWDYSIESKKYLEGAGARNVKHLEIGYQKQLDRIAHSKHKDIDILFYGSINERRKNLLDKLISAGLKVVAIFGVYGAERDSYIARAKIVLNLHSSTPGIFEVVRVSYLLMNRVCVISELNQDSHIDAEWKEGAFCVTYDGMVDAASKLSENEDRQLSISGKGHEFIRQRSQSQFLCEILDN